ncbi:MAG: ABC transporter ATP-binding protein [Candidatus Spyradocola sp.]|nr:ABC transporter ATP-binding protein [Candidatus Spyradocola sp.]
MPVRAKDAKGTMKRLLKYVSEQLPRVILISVLCAITALISILTNRIAGVAIDDYIAVGDMAGLAKLCLGLLAIYLVNIVCSYLQNTNMIVVAQKTSFKLRKDLFAALSRLPLKYFDSHSSGDIMSRLTNDVDNISNTLSQSVTQLFSGIINIIGTLAAMLLLSPILTLISLIAIPVMLLITRAIAKISRRFYREQQKNLGELNGYIEEMVSGQKVIKLFSREEANKADFSGINNRLRLSGTKAEIIAGVMGPFMNMINNITYLIVAVAGGYLVINSVTGAITVGVVFSFLLYMKNFARPISEIANLFNTIQSALAGAERVFQVMDEEPELDAPDAKDVTDIEGNIEIKDVTFSYVPGKPVLKHATITAKKGEQVAIVGPTGAGKTTIISLLTRFYDKDSGQILIDGKPIESITRNSLRRTVGMVLQDTYLFSESVRENIRYGRLDATDEEVERAARMANAHSFIIHLPQGYDTVLADNAGNISQGQRQLIAIARAILADPCLLILDEATSSIDTRTEIKIQDAMLKLMEGRTSFIIAHRLSTIRNADKILVINAGEVVEQGTHDELLAKNGFYANLYNIQFKTGMAI